MIFIDLNKIINYYEQYHMYYEPFWGSDRHFNLHFGYFDRKNTKHDDAVINMNRVLAGSAVIKPGDTVLDAGCGVGGSSVWIAKNCGARVTGISITPIQVEIACKLALDSGVQSLTQFAVRDFEDTKYTSGSFDLVWALESICHARDKKRFLFEAKRILKNNGRIMVADGFISNKKKLTEKERGEMDRLCRGMLFPDPADVNEFKGYLEEAGFKNIRFTDITSNIMPSSRRMYKAFLIGYPFEKIMFWMGRRTEGQMDSILALYLYHKMYRKKKCVYGFFIAES